MRDGLDPETARDKARAAFGNVTAARERHYERQRWPWLDHLRQDVRAALRAMRRYPIAAFVAILSLGFGIGATTITLTVRDVIFRKAPPLYRDPAGISRVQFGTPATVIRRAGARVPSALYVIWASSSSFDSDSGGSNAIRGGSNAIRIAGAVPQSVREVRAVSGANANANASGRTEMIPIRPVTPSLFGVLGVEPFLGRAFADESARQGETTPAVLSYRVWQQLFDGRTDIAGQVFWIDNQPFAVSGVMPERFWFGDMTSPIWIPLDTRRIASEHSLDVVVRRPGGMTPAQLEALLHPGLDEYARQQPAGERRVLIGVSGIEGTPLGHQISIFIPYLLAVSVLLTLLIACANVAVLMIAQWTAREHEVAIRAAIGASRGRIVRALLTESVVIAVAGGLFGVATALVLRGIVIRNGGAAVAFYDLSLDPRLFIATALITVLTGVVAGLAPALYETRRLHGNPLRSMGAADRVRQRWRHALVVFEITVTIALLVQTSAVIDGYRRAMRADLGFATAPLITARVENSAGVQVTQLIETIRALPGVETAAVSTSIPFGARGARDAAAGNVVTSVFTIDEVIKVMGQEILAGTAPLAPLISIGVLLTAAGIYGVLAFAVARRGRELAVRVAMGASRRDLVRLVTMHTLRLVGAGVFFGLGVTFVLARLLRAGGGAGSVFDPAPIAFIVPAALIAALGIAAAWLPARRASAIDPVVLLRNS